jgi:hypothetical protein
MFVQLYSFSWQYSCIHITNFTGYGSHENGQQYEPTETDRREKKQ